jgi:pyrroline-5-carboxylate reductase
MARALSTKMPRAEFELFFCSKGYQSALALATETKGRALKFPEDWNDPDVVILCLKPQQFSELAPVLKNILKPHTLVLSVLAGVGTDRLRTELDHENLIRLMPNLGATVSAGLMTAYLPATHSSPDESRLVCETLFKSSNQIVWVETEEMITASTPHTASTPALFFELARLLALDLEKHGFQAAEARSMIIETFYGSSLMMKNSSLPLADLRDSVTSKKGVTAELLDSLESDKFPNLLTRALDNAVKKSFDLGQNS